MVDLRPRTRPKKLKQILAITDSVKFLDALTDLAIPPGTNFNPLPEKRHELRQMISTMRGFCLYAGNEGVWKFLIEDDAAHWFAKLKVWLKQIGAKKATAYLNATTAAFPGGRVPKNDDKRSDLLLDSEEVSGKLRKLDKEYKDCFAEIAECLRAYIQKNFELFRTELEDNENRAV